MMKHDKLQTIINNAKQNQYDPMVWLININKKTPVYKNALPIHRKIYDVANMMVYKKHLYIMSLNPRAELVRVKTDLLGYINIDNEIPIDYHTWGCVKREWSPPKPTEVYDPSKYIRTNEFKLETKKWIVHKRETLDDDDTKSLLKSGGLVYGKAGTGKSTSLRQVKGVLGDNDNYKIAAFTHKAAEIVGGSTLHKLLGIDMKTNKYDFKLIKSYADAGIKYLLIDEISMIPSFIWNMISHIKKQYGFIIIGFGDWKQLKPVNEEHIDFQYSWIVKYIFNHKAYELTKVWRFNENELLQDAHKASNGETIDYTTYTSTECDLSLCHTNDAVNALNKRWNEHYGKGHTRKITVPGYDNTKFILHDGLKLMAYKTHLTHKFTNSQEFVVLSWTDNTIILKNTKGQTVEIEMKYTTSFKPRFAMTIHKCQGSTFTQNYSIYEYEDMKHDMLYVALTRTMNKSQVNFCNINNYRHHTGYIYSYEFKGLFYIGSTKDLKKRKHEHKEGKKAGNTKFKKAIMTFGFDNFKYKVLDKIDYSNISELWELEDKYIDKYDSINNGFNIRYNREKKINTNI